MIRKRMPNHALFSTIRENGLAFKYRTRLRVAANKQMSNKNRYKFHFGEKNLTLTTDKDNLFMEEVERVAHEKYKIIKEQMKNADNETIAILMAINSLSTQLEREIQVEDMEKELETLRAKQLEQLKVKATATNDDEDDA